MEHNYLKLKAVGDRALSIELGTEIEESVNIRVTELSRRIAAARPPGILEVVPAFTSLLVYYDPLQTDYSRLQILITNLAEDSTRTAGRSGKLVEIPVCYGGRYGEDLSFVARHAGLTEKEVIKIHSGRDYRIFMLGFLPGFPYLGGIDERLVTPRLDSPRNRIPAGSVGIGGAQTGIYPLASPGGWRLIGRTPLKLFRPDQPDRILYEAGDIIRFVPVDDRDYEMG